jgi:hypothetical protein
MLNRKMVILVTIICILTIAVTPVMAGLVARIPAMVEIDKKATVDLDKQLIEYSSDLIKSIGQRLGLIPLEEPTYAIVKDNKVLAILPPDSKFIGVQTHGVCMMWGYGSDNWWICEKRIDDGENLDWSKVEPEVYAVDDEIPIDIKPIDIVKPIVKEKI